MPKAAAKTQGVLRLYVVTARRRLRNSRFLQIAVFISLWWLLSSALNWFGLPLPVGMVGLGLVLALLASGTMSRFTLRRGADWFIAEMMLFFVPALVIAVLQHPDFIGSIGLKLLLVIVLSTLAVMVATAVTVELSFRWRATRGHP